MWTIGGQRGAEWPSALTSLAPCLAKHGDVDGSSVEERACDAGRVGWLSPRHRSTTKRSEREDREPQRSEWTSTRRCGHAACAAIGCAVPRRVESRVRRRLGAACIDGARATSSSRASSIVRNAHGWLAAGVHATSVVAGCIVAGRGGRDATVERRTACTELYERFGCL